MSEIRTDVDWFNPDLNGGSILINPLLRNGLIQGMEDEGVAERISASAILLKSDVYGGSSSKGGDALRNTVTMTGGSVGDNVYGGYSTSGSASENIVTISEGSIGRSVYGGWCRGGSTVSNQVIISGNAVIGTNTNSRGNNVYGGYKNWPTGVIKSNEVTLSNNVQVKVTSSGLGGGVYGGYGEDAMIAVHNNKVTLGDNVLVEGDVAGGYSGYGGAVTSNSVAMNGGTIQKNVYGGYSGFGSVTDNTVNLNAGTVGGNIYGGWSNGDSGTRFASDNSVTLSNTHVTGDVFGGRTYGYNGTTAASDNSVTLSGTTEVTGDVYGGYSTAGCYSDTTGHAMNNTITMNGGTVKGNVYAGSSQWGGYFEGKASVTDNTVNLNAGTVGGTIYGGYHVGGSGDNFTGNTLNVNGYESSLGSVGGLANFENYNFIMPGVLWPRLTTQVHITGATAVDLNNTHVALTGKVPGGGGARLYAGDYVILIDKTTGTPATRSTVPIRHGLSWIYHFRISVEDVPGKLIAILDGVDTAPETENLVDGHLAALAFLNRGADLDPLRTTRCTCGTFVTLGGNWNRYNTGGQIDMDGLSLRAGYSTCTNFACGKLAIAPFFEAGMGGYDTFNVYTPRDFDGNVVENNAIRAHGRINYYGGGLLTKFNLSDGLYYDSSLRVGGLDRNYDSADLSRLSGAAVKYDMTSMYAGLHIGMGREWSISNRMSLDIYGKYMYQYLGGGTVNIAGEPIYFSGIHSNRTRFGGRVNRAVNEYLNGYLGAAWEHEFSGTARASLYEYTLGSPSLRGSTGIGEVGLTLKRTPVMPLNIDFGVQGYVGKREGLAANLQVRWER